jgi:hypothetical protein
MKKIKEVKPKYFEVLNEPAGSWFWGSSAGNAAEAEAYVELLKLLYGEVQKLAAPERPKIIASMDGGQSTSHVWAEKLKAANTNFTNYFDLGSLHPYYKVGGNAIGKLGNRPNVEAVHSLFTGWSVSKHLVVTEVGFPTIKETGDSYKYSEAEQAEAIGGFLGWAKGLGYLDLVVIYQYRDGSGSNGYGLWKLNDEPKPAVARVAAA